MIKNKGLNIFLSKSVRSHKISWHIFYYYLIHFLAYFFSLVT